MIKHIIKFIYFKIKFHHKLCFDFSCKIGKQSSFEGANRLYQNVHFTGTMGYGSYISQNSSIFGNIGRFTSIAPNVQVNGGTHPYTYPYVSTSPMFYSTRKQTGINWVEEQKFQEFKFVENEVIQVKIGNDCWIGQNVFIVGGVTIHDGAVILAGAVVTKDVPPFSIVGGVPAKIIKYRFSEEDVDILLKSKWWEKDINDIKENKELFLDFEKNKQLLEKI